MKKLFKQNQLQQKFDSQGFVIQPLLNQQKTDKLLAIANHFPVDGHMAFYSSSYHKDLELKRKTDAEVRAIVNDEICNIFENFDYLGSAFLYKQPGANGEMPPHQDWTVVNENEACTLTVWIPLQELTPENGAIECIAQSHKKFNFLRAPSVPFVYQNQSNLLKESMETYFLKAGEAFIFNHALVHASSPNHSDTTRTAIAIGLKPKNQPLFMYYRQNGSLAKYAMPDDMFIRYPEVATAPEIGEFIDKKPFEEYFMPEKEVTEILKETTSTAQPKPLFTNPQHQQQFDRDGFIVLPALDDKTIETLKDYYQNIGIKDEMGYGFHVGMDQKNKTLVSEMVDKISAVAMPFVEPYLVETQLFTASFVIKEPNPKGVVPPHQDWTFVEDETQHTSVTCWIPLQDVNIDNGCIGVIKGSHNFFNHLRPSPSPQAPSPLFEHMFTIFPYLHLLEMKAGEALFFNNRTIHASPPNTTSRVRVGIGLGLTQKEAEVRHYYLKPGTKNRVLKYQADAAFYKKYDNPQLAALYEENKQIEDYPILGEMPYEPQSFTKEVWKEKLKEAGNEFNIPLVEKMADLFNYNVDGTPKEEPQAHQEPKQEELHTSHQVNPAHEEQKPKGFIQRVLHKIFG